MREVVEEMKRAPPGLVLPVVLDAAKARVKREAGP